MLSIQTYENEFTQSFSKVDTMVFSDSTVEKLLRLMRER